MNDMRIIVCGGRNYHDNRRIFLTLWEYKHLDPIIVHGNSRGADRAAAREAQVLGLRAEAHPAHWDELGKKAGPTRNQEMIDAGADLLIAFRGGKGTNDCIRRAHHAKIPVLEVDRG